MSTLEEKLRDAFRADAGTVRPESVPAFDGVPDRPRRARARLLIPVTAALAVAAISAGVWGTASVLHGHSHGSGSKPSSGGQISDRGHAAGPLPLPVVGSQAPRALATSPAHGLPRFFVTDEPANVPHASDLVVRSTGSGKIAGIVAPPSGTFFGSVDATGPSTFLTSVIRNNGQPCVNKLYQFRVNGRGQPGPLMALHVTVPGTFYETNPLAITPDGRTIAYVTYLCGQGRGELGVIDLATRHVRLWGVPRDGFPLGLSLSADGRLLAFADVLKPSRILTTTAAGGSIYARARILSRGSDWVALTGSGSAFYGCEISPRLPLPPSQKASLTYFWQALGHSQRHVIATWRNVSNPMCMASLDPSGRYLLLQFPAGNYLRPVILDLMTGQTTSIAAPAYYAPLTIVW